ncbi:DUF559 domain-containing protein [Actinotalea sp. C106]|uniref:DUF559 domain-containing protein n=1 Tax=Actinotalea sp. C106 TaxID=2908644 RepID=UPI00202929E0|nr:DUF559 domain-containing protein [Actinotalea sp. C106]
MARRPAALPDALVGRPFTRRDARELGIGDDRLRRRDLSAPFTGVRDTTQDGQLEQRCLAALCALPPGSVLSHTTALRLYGVPLPWQLEREASVHVHLPPGASRVRRRGVMVHHRAEPLRADRLGPLPVVPPSQAWCDAATLVGGEDLVVVGDGLLRRKSPPTSLERLADHVSRLAPRARGRRRLLEALPLLRTRTDSPMETRTRLVLVQAGLPCPHVNELVRDARGDVVAMPDLLYPHARLAIEHDGDVHRTDPTLWRRDVERREMLQDLGYLVLVVTADVIRFDPDTIVRRVRNALRTRT